MGTKFWPNLRHKCKYRGVIGIGTFSEEMVFIFEYIQLKFLQNPYHYRVTSYIKVKGSYLQKEVIWPKIKGGIGHKLFLGVSSQVVTRDILLKRLRTGTLLAIVNWDIRRGAFMIKSARHVTILCPWMEATCLIVRHPISNTSLNHFHRWHVFKLAAITKCIFMTDATFMTFKRPHSTPKIPKI